MREPMLRRLGVVAALLMSVSLGVAAETAEKKTPVYATFKTSMGDIVIQLFDDKAPKTVANFVGLASGTKEWVDPKTGEKVKRPLYNGTIFHRVIPGFMIQGGDPLGNGTGGPGYRFEATPNLDGRHSVFGEVVKGQEVVVAIGGVARDLRDRPIKDVVIKEIVITRGSY